jgi:hypothetical protein
MAQYEASPMFSNPSFSKLDATIIAVLLCGGAAAMIEANHRILIVAPDVEETLSISATNSGNLVPGPTGDPMLAPPYAPPVDYVPMAARSTTE